ncbi:M3 family oligoendopeptidase [Defluviitalea phaphyphila]|uniref:M3 family oligoendopeptidase n=1 Tax=Defluviitalea phaphyphila TaxID=1473580 RepID=UPI000B17C0C2|nr:M3 family oligoendopeptidase [Defluviitalea phaphyphila]
MNMRWSLKELYPSFDSDLFKNDMKKCFELITKINDWVKFNLDTVEGSVYKIETFLKMQIEFGNIYSRLYEFAFLTLSVDAKNEQALQIIELLENKSTDLAEPLVKFKKWLSKFENLDTLISCSDLLKEHTFYLNEFIAETKYLLNEKEEVLIAKMKNTGSKAWEKLQELLSSTLLVDINIDGEEKKLPLSIVRNMAYEKDASIRKKAYEAELKAYDKIAESSAAALNGIKGEVITESKIRGYSSPLEMTLIHSRMDQETLDAMFTAIKESLPSFRKYLRKKAEILGHKNGLPFFDLFAPLGEIEMKFTYEEAQNFIVKNFSKFSPSLGNFAKNAFEKQWIDAEPREGKRGGAFCSNIHSIKESRILSNFTGMFNDVTTLAHELGHGYHGECLKNETYLNSDYPMPIAETASIFAETIIINAALKEASQEEAFAILESDLMSSTQVIVDIYSRFLFEDEVFKRRENHSLSVDELNQLMLDSQIKAYGDGLDKNYLHPYMWICKPHYYSADYNYYNFPYAFGLLFSKGLYAIYLEKGKDFVPEFNNLLASTGKNNLVDVAKKMNIDLHSLDFWRNSLKLIEKDIEKFINM